MIKPTDAGSTVRVTHSAYGDSQAEQADRESHRNGWLHFLDRLAAEVEAAGS